MLFTLLRSDSQIYQFDMKYLLSALLLCVLTVSIADVQDGRDYKVTVPPESLRVPGYFQKHVSAGGYPIILTDKVKDYALKEEA